MKPRLRRVAVLLAIGGCAVPASRPTATPCALQDPTPVASAAESRSAASADLIVGSQRGLEAWSRDGSTQRRISLGPALHPRWLGGDAVLVLSPLQPGEQRDSMPGARVERISLRDGQRVEVAQMPRFQCAGASTDKDAFPDPGVLDVQDPSDFQVAKDGRTACIALMDRNINMANVLVRVRVDLDSGAVARWLEVGEPECKTPAGVGSADESESEDCVSADDVVERREPSDARYAFADGSLSERDAAGKRTLKLRLKDYDAGAISPSGRWQLLEGESEEGDYFYRRLVLLDREAGSIYPIPMEAGSWPAPLTATPGEGRPRIAAPGEKTIQVWGEVDVRWLGESPTNEVLVIGELIVRPGQLRFRVDGEVVR